MNRFPPSSADYQDIPFESLERYHIYRGPHFAGTVPATDPTDAERIAAILDYLGYEKLFDMQYL